MEKLALGWASGKTGTILPTVGRRWGPRSGAQPWHIAAESWQDSIWLYEPAWWYADGRYDDLAAVTFSVSAPETTPLNLSVSL
jgi:hypothetical protein